MTEDQLEQEALGWLADVGYTHVFGPDIGPDGPTPERASYQQVLLPFRLREAIHRLNPGIPIAAREDALKQVLDLGIPVLLSANRHFHRLLVDGVPVQYQKDGETRGDFVRLIDWAEPAKNDWLAVNQFSIKGPHHTRRPDIILFVNGLPLVLLERLLEGEIKSRFASNVVQNRKFTELLANVITRYQNRSIETAQVMEELVQMARKFREAASRGEQLGLTEDEVRFYDALANNESAVRELTDETLKKIAHELTENLRQNLSVDWSERESVRAKLRLMVKRILRKYKYPPDLQDAAVGLVLQQAQVMGESWAMY